MKPIKKNLILVIIGIIVAFVVVIFIVQKKNKLAIPDFSEIENTKAQTAKSKSDQKEEISLIINYGEKQDNYGLEIEGGDTVFSVLKRLAQDQNLDLNYSDSELGVFVDKIGEQKNTKNEFWVCDLNQESGKVAADKQKIKSGDIVEWKFTKF